MLNLTRQAALRCLGISHQATALRAAGAERLSALANAYATDRAEPSDAQPSTSDQQRPRFRPGTRAYRDGTQELTLMDEGPDYVLRIAPSSAYASLRDVTREDVARLLSCKPADIRVKYNFTTMTPDFFAAVFPSKETRDEALSRATSRTPKLGSVEVSVVVSSFEEWDLVRRNSVMTIARHAATYSGDSESTDLTRNMAHVTSPTPVDKSQILDALASHNLVPPFVVPKDRPQYGEEPRESKSFIAVFASPADAVNAACDPSIGKLRVKPLA